MEVIYGYDQYRMLAVIKSTQLGYETTYPNATRLSTYDIKYNCHSYAWYSTSPNLYWIDDPSAYMDDDSY